MLQFLPLCANRCIHITRQTVIKMGLNMRQQFEVPVISVEYSYKFVRESYQVSNIPYLFVYTPGPVIVTHTNTHTETHEHTHPNTRTHTHTRSMTNCRKQAKCQPKCKCWYLGFVFNALLAKQDTYTY